MLPLFVKLLRIFAKKEECRYISDIGPKAHKEKEKEAQGKKILRKKNKEKLKQQIKLKKLKLKHSKT
jgi:hypothetical protein